MLNAANPRRSRVAIGVAALCSMASPAVSAETDVSQQIVFGRAIGIAAPQGFCAVPRTGPGAWIFEVHRQRVAPAGVLLQWAAPCEEVNGALMSQTPGTFSRWTQALVPTYGRPLILLNMPRDEFASSVGQAQAQAKDSYQTLNEELRRHPEGHAIRLEFVRPLGWDALAAYTGLLMTLQTKEARQVAAVEAATVLNRLPVSITAYEHLPATGSRRSLYELAIEQLKASIPLNKD